MKIFKHKIFDFILDLLFPISCLGCDKKDTWLCDNCLEKIKLQEDPVLSPTTETKNLDKLISACHYKGSLLEKIIPTFKYKFVTDLARPLSKILIWALEKFKLPSDAILIPVPLHRKRFRKRGFNQAELLAKKLAKHFDISLRTDLIIRHKNTLHQARLSRDERLKNLHRSFRCINPALVKNKNVILVDDVSTTGATLNKIADTLKSAGAKTVWGLVIAHE